MFFYLIDLRSQVYAVENLLAGKSERDILKWLETKGKLTNLKPSSGKSRSVYKFISYFELRSDINFNCIFFLQNREFIFIGEHCTFRPRKLL